jgi:hypothetical protein
MVPKTTTEATRAAQSHGIVAARDLPLEQRVIALAAALIAA